MLPFPYLFTPGKIGSLTLKNRIIMPSMSTGFAHINGEVSEKQIQYYTARAQGGAALIIVEVAGIDHPFARQGLRDLRVDQPTYMAGLNSLAEAIQAYQCRAFLQLFHAGRQTSPTIIEGQQPVAPSALACRNIGVVPQELSTSEILALVKKFAQAAVTAKTAGFDGIEIHAAHGYLLSGFLSPFSNQRQDAYGGSLENRLRFLLEVIQEIRAKTGSFPLSIRFNAKDFLDTGLELSEGVEIAQRLAEAKVDLLHVSSGMYESGLTSIEPASYPEGWRIYLAAAVKKAVKIPVLAGGVLRTPEKAESVLQTGQADFVFIGRGMLADPAWASKARQGKNAEIRPCISCNTCINRDFQGLELRCAVNPQTGRETWMSYPPAQQARKIWVVGAGPGGMQAAISLAHQGHQVTLWEKAGQLGGLLNLAQLPPFKQRLGQLQNYLTKQIEQLPIQVLLNTPFQPGTAPLNKQPDLLVIATGALPITPSIPGLTSIPHYTLEEALQNKLPLAYQRIGVIGGGANGCEVAEVLAQAGHKVTIMEMQASLSPDLEKKNRRDLLNRLKERGVVSLTQHQVILAQSNQTLMRSLQTNQKIPLLVDALVFAVGYKSLDTLSEYYQNLGWEVRTIGDAAQVRGIEAALYEGACLVHHPFIPL